MKKKILFIDNGAHHLYGQMHLIEAFERKGYSIVVLCPHDSDYVDKIKDKGYSVNIIHLNGKSRNPGTDLVLVGRILRKIKKISPALICSFTIKPNLYGAIAARRLKIPIIANITGLGYVFMKKNMLNNFVIRLYRYAFKKLDCAFFQNPDDQNLMVESKIFQPLTNVILLPGSGVNIEKFPYCDLADKQDKITFLFSGRLLYDKGLHELISAMKLVKQKYPDTRLVIIGNYFLANPNGVKHSVVESWVKDGIVEYLGMVQNVAEVMRDIDCMVLPSYYREGIPRVLMEACSMGKPIITVDNVGCREVIEDGVNGYMAQPRDVDTLAEAMIKFIELPYKEKLAMGKAGRKKMEREFDQKIVINKYLEAAKQLLHAKE